MLKNILATLYKNSHIIRNNKITHKEIFNNYINQIGGNKKNIKIKYKKQIFTFEESNIDEEIYVLYSTDELECVYVVIHNSDKVAEIHGISNYKTCVNITFSNLNVGSILLKLTIKMLKKYKNKFNINKIILVDNSLKQCKKYNIEFSTMMILLNGHTWYGKYGFRPFDSDTYNLNKIKNKQYDNNITIMSSITIQESNLLEYIKLTKKEKLINDVIELLDKTPNYLLCNYIQSFLNKDNYNKTCKYFNMFYRELFDNIGLTNFRGSVFGLNI